MELKSIISKVKKAQEIFSKFSQEKVDKIFYEAAKAANNARISLAKMAVEETGMGVVEDKIIKNHYGSEIIFNKYKDFKTVGTFLRDEGLGIEKVYEPVGVIAAIIPVTNPTSTAFFKTLLSLKTRNGVILSPHPKARNCTIAAAKIILDAAVKVGAPEDIISWLPENSSIDDTNNLMKEADLILATGGSGLVKSAYSSGTPAIGVGAGNCPAIIDSSAKLDLAISSIIQSNTFDNGVVCATENSVIVLKDIYEDFCKEVKKQGGYIISNLVDIKNIENNMFKSGKFGLLNPDMVGQNPQTLGKVFNINVPTWAKMLFVETSGTKYEDPLAHEKLSTMVSLYKADSFEHALEIQSELLKLGPGHTSSLFINEEAFPEKVSMYKNNAKTGRMLINMPSSLGAIGDLYNFGLNPTLTIGCGTWGGNIFSENITPMHLLNIKTLASRRENMLWLRVPEKIYFKFGAINEALKDLKEEGIKKVFIVTDLFIWSLYGKKVSLLLENSGIHYKIFSDVEPNPSLKTCKRGAEEIVNFEPDAIMAIGGGSPLDAAKIMWLFYEDPNAKFEDLSMRFSDIRKRIVRYPQLGKKCKMICVPTTSGTGSEVTPFAIITDEQTHIKYSLADYSLTPNMAIIDSQLMMNLPKKLTAATGMDAFTHAVESFTSILANEFTDPYALEALKKLYKYLPIAFSKGSSDKESREYVAHSATIAGIAFANSFLGIVHSLSHKIGGHFNVMHGMANAIYLPYVIYYNAQQGVREKQGYFSQYSTMTTREKYVQIANHLGIEGKDEIEKIDNLIKEIINLTKKLELPTSTKEYGVDSVKFYQLLDQMAEEAFDDQCTGANPRIPLINDLKEIFIAAHEGYIIPSIGDHNNNLFCNKKNSENLNTSFIKNINEEFKDEFENHELFEKDKIFLFSKDNQDIKDDKKFVDNSNEDFNVKNEEKLNINVNDNEFLGNFYYNEKGELNQREIFKDNNNNQTEAKQEKLDKLNYSIDNSDTLETLKKLFDDFNNKK